MVLRRRIGVFEGSGGGRVSHDEARIRYQGPPFKWLLSENLSALRGRWAAKPCDSDRSWRRSLGGVSRLIQH
jgi:hypothetical protein